MSKKCQSEITNFFQKRKSPAQTQTDNKLIKLNASVDRRLQSIVTSNQSGNTSTNNDFDSDLLRAKTVLLNVFGYNSFLTDQQSDAILEVLSNGTDVLVLTKTGSGKSLCYQLPAVCDTINLESEERGSVTIVISPLLALINDQISYLDKLSIKAVTYNSSTSTKQRTEIETELLSNKSRIVLLYITPEMALRPNFIEFLDHFYSTEQLKRIAVDEAHLVVEWGYEFRQSYLKLGSLKERYPLVQWVALTASATSQVISEIKTILKLREPVSVFDSSNYRDNLYYEIVFKDVIQDDPVAHLSKFIRHEIYPNESVDRSELQVGIVYCREKSTCDELSKKLLNVGITCGAYHSDMSIDQRNSNQCKWMSGELKCLVATVCFGLGIHNPNVRFVVHWNVPLFLSSYYEQSGRAGRDGRPAKCRIYYSNSDRKTNLFLLDRDMRSGLLDRRFVCENFIAMINYCENRVHCRHKMLQSTIVDERLSNGCEQVCDLCVKRDSVNHSLQQYFRKYGSIDINWQINTL